MNEAIKNMKTRRSVRSFKSEMPDKETIDAIIDAGLSAPSGKNMQTPIILAVTNKEIRDRLSHANAGIMGSTSDPFYGAPAVLIVLAKSDFPTYVYDGSLVMGNLMLAAHSLGVASCWIHRARETFELPEWRNWLRTLGIDDSYVGIGNCVIGYLDGEYPLPRGIRDGRIFRVD